MATLLMDPEVRADDERTIIITDFQLPEGELEDDTHAEFERERYDEQILAGLASF